MELKVLSDNQVEQFIERGWTKLEQGFAREDALASQDFLWEELRARGIAKDDPATWTTPLVHLQESYSDEVFQKCNTERLADAVEDLVGVGRWPERGKKTLWGWWPINFPQGAAAKWDVPAQGWHWDGQHFRHYSNSPNQGLLLLCCFSSAGPQGGGTLVASGSHKVVARFLSAYPDGLEHSDALRTCIRSHPWLADLAGLSESAFNGEADSSRVERFMDRTWVDTNGIALRVDQVCAEPGDVYLCHPFLYHATSINLTGSPRFMCNRTTALAEPMQFARSDGNYSPLEESIRRALNMAPIGDFAVTG